MTISCLQRALGVHSVLLSAYTIQKLIDFNFFDVTSYFSCIDYDPTNKIRLWSVAYWPSLILCGKVDCNCDQHTIVVVNLSKRKLLAVVRKTGEHKIESFPCYSLSSGILDLSPEGDRWEGAVLNDIPFGWGCYYNSRNQLVFEGFRVGQDAVCYGTYFHIDTLTVTTAYQGMISFGKRHGQGYLWGRDGSLISSLFWFYDKHFNGVYHIPPNSETVLRLNSLISQLVIENNNYTYCNTLHLYKFQLLQRVRIGECCFSSDQIKNGSFCIEFCPLLEEVIICPSSFVYFDSFCLQNLPRLLFLEIGSKSLSSRCFYSCSSLKLLGRVQSDCLI